MNKKMIVVGVDGGSFPLVKKWIKQGKLPGFKRLAEKGFFSEFESCLPPLTAPANATLSTGKRPGNHGVFDFIEPEKEKIRLVNSESIRGESLWKTLSENGKKCCIINMPLTFPPEKISGLIISGMLSPSVEKAFSDPTYLEELEKAGIDYSIGEDRALSGDPEKIIEYYSNVFSQRKKTAEFFLEKEKWDFFLVYFRATDILSHYFWKHMDCSHPLHKKEHEKFKDVIFSFYKKIDSFLLKLIEEFPDRAIVVFSDHGFCPLYGTVNLNLFFAQKSLLKFKNSPKTLLKRLFFSLGINPSNAYSFIRKTPFAGFIKGKSLEEKEKGVEKFLSYSDIDWSKTVAFSRGHIGQVFINAKKGTKEYKEALNKTVSALRELKKPDGTKMKIELVEGKKVHKGKYSNKAPDLYVIMDDFKYIAFPLFASSNKVFDVQIEGNSANHDRSGILLAAGPGIKKASQKKACIEDFAPSILSFFGYSQDYMDGIALKQFGTASKKLEKRDKKKIEGRENKELEKRLKGLGYL